MNAAGADRIALLDVTRGVAVMGILLANLPDFALPDIAESAPFAWGGRGLDDRIAWGLNYVFVEGRMRGLFSFLFGASMLLVFQGARRAGEDEAGVHYSRMTWLFLFGLAHLYLVWPGDILHHYALVGAIAYGFRNLGVRALVWTGLGFVAVQALIFALVSTSPFFLTDPGSAATRAETLAEIGAMRGGWLDGIAYRWRENQATPVVEFLAVGWETLGYMLWGMAGLKSGLLTGDWSRERYLYGARVLLTVGLAGYSALAAMAVLSGFDARYLMIATFGAATPIRPLVIVGYACAIALLARPGGWWTDRVAAVGRAAFTNYLGTSIVMTFVFNGWGLGLFGRVGRAEMYLLVPFVWALMLWWSKPWLARYRHGPLEWVWRSLARLEWQPLRRQA